MQEASPLASGARAGQGAQRPPEEKGCRVSVQEITGTLWAVFSVMLIDLVLAGDNAILVGLAASGVPSTHRRSVIVWGVAVATLLRIAFATIALKLISIIGLTLAGGILLLWVAWKIGRAHV